MLGRTRRMISAPPRAQRIADLVIEMHLVKMSRFGPEEHS
jgi:hypothetical protein